MLTLRQMFISDGVAYARHNVAVQCNRLIPRLFLQEVDGVNLVNQHGSELILSKAFEEQAAAFAKTNRGFRLITFDFHKQCGATSYHKCVRPRRPIGGSKTVHISTLCPGIRAATPARCHLLVSW